MIQTGWRLERTYLAGAGFRESRLEGLNLHWADPTEPSGHAALWGDNGTGKTTITALRFALYLPDARDFIRGGSDRSLAKLVRSGDVCHVVEQATRMVNGEVQRVVVGFVAQWPDGTQDLANPSKLQRFYYGWVGGEGVVGIDSLPFRTGAGRWATRAQFVEALRAMLPSGGALPPHSPADHQGRWREWLVAAGVDLEQVRFQTVMNASEGGVDNVMKFHDSDAFVNWLIGAITPTSTVEQIRKSIDVLRANAAARPRWTDELALWERLTGPLLDLAVAHEAVTKRQRALATAEASATAMAADADATMTALEMEQKVAAERRDHHDRRRRDAVATLRRAQAHRLRMQMRAAKLRADAAQATAEALAQQRTEAATVLAAWEAVPDVHRASRTRSQLAGLVERLNAAEKEAAALSEDEARHRHALARLLTDNRDRSAHASTEAQARHGKAVEALKRVDDDLRDAVSEHATAVERERQAEQDAEDAEQVLADAVAAGLVDEGADPAEVDKTLETQVAAARTARNAAEADIRRIDELRKTQEGVASAAEQRAKAALADAAEAERQLNDVDRRVAGLLANPWLIEAVGEDVGSDLWAQRVTLVDNLDTRATAADAEALAARADAAVAQRVIDSVGADGLLPSSALAEEVARRCRENTDDEIPAWPGWRWLADTMTPEAARTFAAARPEIASGVVVAHADLLERAVTAIGDMDLDVAMWVGVVTDAAAAAMPDRGSGTLERVVMPHPGIYDRRAARDMVDSAKRQHAEASERENAASGRATAYRNILAALTQLWSDLPDDPRPGHRQRIANANSRRQAAEEEQAKAANQVVDLQRQHTDRVRDRDNAQQVWDDGAERRRLLAPVIAAAATVRRIKQKLPGLRTTVSETRRRVNELNLARPSLAAKVEEAAANALEAKRRREDAAEALRAAGLSPTTQGPVPDDDQATIRARLASVEAALQQAAIDPELRQQVGNLRQELSDLDAKLDADPERRERAEQFAVTDDARHPVALNAAIDKARRREADARERYATAKATAAQAATEYQRWADDKSDKSSPDVDGFPSVTRIAVAEDADLYADQLNDLAAQLQETQRAEERQVAAAEDRAKNASLSRQLVEATVKPLLHLRDESTTGRPWTDIESLTSQIGGVSERLRICGDELREAEREQQDTAGKVRANANGPHARKVEEIGDPRVLDLLARLRADEHLASESERLAEQLEQRAATLRDDLNNHEQHVRTCATMLHIQAATAIDRIRAYQNQSRMPDGLGDWSQRHFVTIDHQPVPDDESVAVDRVARLVHSLLTPNAGRSDAQSLLFGAARALVDAPFRVRILKPHTDLSLERVDVAELKNFSGGQRVTAGVLLYATMTRVRAAGGDATSIGWLWLDNPFGQASADQFVRTMRRAADQLGLQLVFTAAPVDKGALSMFDRVIVLAQRQRPSSKEKVVVVEQGSREVVDLALIQRDVKAVLGG